MALSTARMHKLRGRPPLLAAGINSLIHSHSSSVRTLGYVFSFIYPFYTTHEDFSDMLLERYESDWRIRLPTQEDLQDEADRCAGSRGRLHGYPGSDSRTLSFRLFS